MIPSEKLNRYRGFVESYVCDKGTTLEMVVSNFKTGLVKKELLNQDIENILVEVYEHNVKSVDGSTVYPDLFRERKQRYKRKNVL